MAVRLAHVNYMCVLATFLLNLLGTIVVAGGGAIRGVNVVYSIFNIIIYGIVGMYAFYNGYKGLATRNGRLTDQYVGLQALALVFMFAASIASGATATGGPTPRGRARALGQWTLGRLVLLRRRSGRWIT